jgi:hypothetical protein
MSILKRPPGDQFSFKLFLQLCSTVKKPKDVFYLWSICIDPYYNQLSYSIGNQQFYENEILYRNYIMDGIKTDIIILGIKDHLTSYEFNPWTDDMPNMIVWLEQMAEYYSDKTIVLLTSLENLEFYIKAVNVKIIPWGGDITNHKLEYEKVDPLDSKNFDSKYTFLSLNRNLRHHRTILISLLYGLKLNDVGLISAMFKNSIHSIPSRHTHWKFSNEQSTIADIIDAGFRKFKTTPLILNDDYEIYTNWDNNNANNFKNKLIHYYRDTFIDIITETSCTERCFNLTEKTLNSIYGKSFPILISSPGVIAFLRNAGMDMFDDIIDHSYDTIENPIDRIYQSITLNIDLLTNADKVKKLWKINEHRFIKNIDFAKNKLYNFYATRTTERFNNVIENI